MDSPLKMLKEQKSSTSISSGHSNQSPKEPETKNIYFHCHRELVYGQNLYIVGNIPQLKNWESKKALRMQWTNGHHWRLTVKVDKSLEGVVEYKYLVGDYDRMYLYWDLGYNQKLYIHGKNSGSFTNLDNYPSRILTRRRSGSGSLCYSPQQNELIDEFMNGIQQTVPFSQDKYLKVMSFNIWSKMDLSWNKRSKVIIKLLQEENCDFVGVQELIPFQREFIKGNLHNYAYFGESRSEDINDEQNGIFYRRDKFFKTQGGNQWFGKENKKPDFEAKLPRMLTWAIFQDLQNENRQIGVINTHFDHQSVQSRIEGSKIVSKLAGQLNQACDILVILGDFNDREESQSLENLFKSDEIFSCRYLYDPINKKNQYGKQDNIIQKQLVTFHNNQGENCKSLGTQVDHVLYMSRKQYQLYNFKVVQTTKKNKNGEVTYPSDHYPVVCEFYTEQ